MAVTLSCLGPPNVAFFRFPGGKVAAVVQTAPGVIIVLKYLYQDLLANIVHLRGQCMVTQKACGVLKQIADLTIVPEALPCPHTCSAFFNDGLKTTIICVIQGIACKIHHFSQRLPYGRVLCGFVQQDIGLTKMMREHHSALRH